MTALTEKELMSLIITYRLKPVKNNLYTEYRNSMPKQELQFIENHKEEVIKYLNEDHPKAVLDQVLNDLSEVDLLDPKIKSYIFEMISLKMFDWVQVAKHYHLLSLNFTVARCAY